ncbi:hypothetical protein DXA09_15175 [Absiella sp. AM54-8XD]|jgi:hypothetical protein|uniref:hypothetical protein n=1 Tax=unclassified Amedibacterium TaxID=3088137 RepID=UPI000E40E9EA|nr:MULTISPECIES: hypothetical protein [unclassified Absiella]RGC19390.1 hypothetical protein DXA09_15175 [Absiella sp. AM54-8XD]RGC50636.1 hypothetical protein DW761_11740 [Absiella sp. AM29-15]
MKLLRYEWKKLLKSKLFIFSFIVLFGVHLLYSFVPYVMDYHNNGEVLQIEKSLKQKVSGPITSETFEKINALKQKINPQGETNDTQADKIYLNLIETEVNNQIDYSQQMKDYCQNIKDNIVYLETHHEKRQVLKYEKLYQTYEGRTLSYYDNQKGWDKLLDNQTSVIFILLIMMITLPMVYSREKESDMELILYSTKIGNQQIQRGKLYFTISFVMVLVVLFSLIDAILTLSIYGFDGAQLPVYTNAAYHFSTMNVTMLGYWLYRVLFQLIALCCMGVIILTISRRIKNPMMSIMITFAFVSGLLLLGETGFTTWNPCGLLYLNKTVNDVTCITIYHHSFYTYQITLLLDVCILLMIFLYTRYTRRRKSL